MLVDIEVDDIQASCFACADERRDQGGMFRPADRDTERSRTLRINRCFDSQPKSWCRSWCEDGLFEPSIEWFPRIPRGCLQMAPGLFPVGVLTRLGVAHRLQGHAQMHFRDPRVDRSAGHVVEIDAQFWVSCGNCGSLGRNLSSVTRWPIVLRFYSCVGPVPERPHNQQGVD